MMRRTIIGALLVCLLLVCLLPLSARAAGPEGSLREGQSLRGRFVQERRLQGFNAPLRSEGTFVLAVGKGLIWRAEKPFAITTAISPAGLVQDVGGNETMRLPSSRLPFLSRLYGMLGGALAGDWQAMAQDFTVQKFGNAQSWQVILTPRNGPDPVTMPFSAITAKGGRFVDTVTIAKPDGDYDQLTFLDQTLSADPLPPGDSAALTAPAP